MINLSLSILLLSVTILFLFRNVLSVSPFTVVDLHDLKKVGDFHLSQENLVYSSTHWESSTSVTTTNLKIVSLDSETQVPNPKDLTSIKSSSDSNPIFLSSDVIVFLSSRSGISNIYQIEKSGSSMRRISNYEIDISNLKIGKHDDQYFFIFSANVYLDCPDFECTATRNEIVRSRGSNTYMEFDKLFVRHWDHYITENKASHLFLQNFKLTGKKVELQGDPIDLMKDMKYNTPVPPFGGRANFDIAPDGTQIAFTAEIMDNSSVAWTTSWRIFVVDLNPISTPVLLTEDDPARTQNPVYSSDSKKIAYLAMTVPKFEADQNHIMVRDRETFAKTPVAPNWFYSPDRIVWANNDTVFLADADADGRHKLFSINIETGAPTELISNGSNSGVLYDPETESVTYTASYWTSPSNIYQFNFTNGVLTGQIQKLTDENSEAMEDFAMSEAEYFNFSYNWTNAEGGEEEISVQGWLWRPYNFEQGNSYPLSFLIHGGPQGAWGSGWSYRWNPQLWASRGYVTVAINPRGSTGFGQDFTNAVTGDWGGGPYDDLMAGLDYVKANYPFVDGNRMCAAGASYGGYMINWILGHENEFKCLVVHDGVSDTIGMYYSTEELWFVEHEFDYPPFVNDSIYHKWNPLNLIDNWDTPTLVIHGIGDYRIDLSQGLTVFTALQRRGIESKLLLFTEEDHWVIKPQNGIKWYSTVLDWLDHYTDNTSPYPPSSLAPSLAPTLPKISSSKDEKNWHWIVPTAIAALLLVLVVVLLLTRGRSGYQEVN